MGQNFPNPFNPQTEIKYSIEDKENDRVTYPLKAVISIFNVRGQQIRKLQEREVGPGDYSVRWDGKDDNGEPVSSGSYYYRLTIISPGTQEIVMQLSKKMVLLR
jgi:flagellar hook assembly protein FlgD